MREHKFRAMGTDCHLIVNATDEQAATRLIELALARVELLEACWSRFRPLSELNRLNAQAGTGPKVVSEDLLALVAAMREAWSATDGLFDPTILSSMHAIGYNADFATVLARDAIAITKVGAAPGMGDILINVVDHTVTLPAGVGIDPGAIGKGLAADIIVTEIMAAGATGVLVNLGGDIVVAGIPVDADGAADSRWIIGVEDERNGSAPHSDGTDRVTHWLYFPAGTPRSAVATSTVLKRRWADGRHHVIDPRTGDVARGDLVQVTIAADSGAAAETAATAALLLGADRATTWLTDRDLVGLLMTSDDLITTAGAPELVGVSRG